MMKAAIQSVFDRFSAEAVFNTVPWVVLDLLKDKSLDPVERETALTILSRYGFGEDLEFAKAVESWPPADESLLFELTRELQSGIAEGANNSTKQAAMKNLLGTNTVQSIVDAPEGESLKLTDLNFPRKI